MKTANSERKKMLKKGKMSEMSVSPVDTLDFTSHVSRNKKGTEGENKVNP